MNFHSLSATQPRLAQLRRSQYRADIDGLRAIAVLAVVVFHAFPSSFHGGFTGVDIFFVISGFLISTIIFDSLDRDRFSFSEFYGRRIKRIFPALLLVLFASWAFSEFALLPDEYSQLGRHITGGAGFFANFLFWRESGYFDDAAITKPLLHLWSLSIEEQFYVVWPLLVWLTWRRKAVLLSVILVITAASFVFNIVENRQGSASAFYFPHTRFWELMAGALLAYARFDGKGPFAFMTRRAPSVSAAIVNTPSLLGATLIASGFIFIDKGDPFPGWWALLPVLGTVLVMASGPDAWFNRVILANRALVWIGLISFPLYLWHWPMLSFAQILQGGTPSVTILLSVVLASIVLADLTYRFVEKPIRFGSLHHSMTAPALGLLMVAMGGIGSFANTYGPLVFGLEDRDNIQAEFARSPPGRNLRMAWEASGHECSFIDFSKAVAGDPSPPALEAIDRSCYERDPLKPKSVFVWGNSFAQMLRYGLNRQMPGDWQILQVATSGCRADFKASTAPACARSNAFAIDRIKAIKPDVVLIGSNQDDTPDEAKLINDTFKSYGVGKVVFVGPTPPWTAHLPKIVARHLSILKSERTFVSIEMSLIKKYAGLKAAYAARNLSYVDVTGIFCSAAGCLTRIGDDMREGMVSYDNAHLMPVASDFLARNGLVAAITGDDE